MTYSRFYVLTGGPGSGKSSLVAALAARGLPTMTEGGRAIIRGQKHCGGDALPWKDALAFADAMLAWDRDRYREAGRHEGPVIFDRAVPDIIGYLKVEDLPVSPKIAQAAKDCRYSQTVFLAPHWDDIFCQDKERRQDRAKAKATCDAMTEVYGALGYTLVHLPKGPIAERARFVLDHIGSPSRQP